MGCPPPLSPWVQGERGEFRGEPVYNIGMEADSTQYDPRYLAGIVLFNRGDFFEAHEVWESLWMETFTPEKKFYQGLIQAAVALCHFCNALSRSILNLPWHMHTWGACTVISESLSPLPRAP